MQVGASAPVTPGDRTKAIVGEGVKWGAIGGAGLGLVNIFVGTMPGLTRPKSLLLGLVGYPLLGAAAGAVAGLAGAGGLAMYPPRTRDDYVGSTAGSVGFAGMATGLVAGAILGGKLGGARDSWKIGMLVGGVAGGFGGLAPGAMLGGAAWDRLHRSTD